MDSGSSGSLQSSSGGEEEYDSRSDSISAVMSQTGHIGGAMSNFLPPLSQQHQTTADPLSNYLDPISRTRLQHQNPSLLLNLDTLWSRTVRSDRNCTANNMNPILPTSSSSIQSFIVSDQGQKQYRVPLGNQSEAVSFPPIANSNLPRVSSTSTASAAASDHYQQQPQQKARNPRKRSRASRRAPTTVLTTDTTNFLAMVQEFTGIPAPPFTSSHFPRTRLDLFGTTPLRSTPLETQPPYLLRPFAQKVQPPQFVSSSLLSSAMVDTIASSGGSKTISPNIHPVNYQLVSELGLLKQHQSNPLNMQNSILTFPSLSVPQPHRYPLAHSTILGTKIQGSLDQTPLNDSYLTTGSLSDLGLSHDIQLTGVLTNVVPSNGTAQRKDCNNIPTNWGDPIMASNDGDHQVVQSMAGDNDHNNYLRNITSGSSDNSYCNKR